MDGVLTLLVGLGWGFYEAVASHWRLEACWVDHHYGDAQLRPQTLEKSGKSKLGGAVGRSRRQSELSRERRNHDYPSIASFDHRKRVLGQVNIHIKVSFHKCFKHRHILYFLKLEVSIDSSVEYEAIDAIVQFLCPVNELSASYVLYLHFSSADRSPRKVLMSALP